MNDIDRVLREDARTAIPDNGFSARVMGTLPRREGMKSSWLAPVLVFGSAALGSVLAIAFAPAGNSVLQGFADLVQMRGFTPAAITAVAMGVALLASALVLAVETD